MTLRPRRRRLALTSGLALAAVGLSACGSTVEQGASVSLTDWDAVLAAAEGQTVDWYMFGGDQRLNELVDGVITERLAEAGVTLRQVRISDTAEAVTKVLGEVQAGRTTGGSVDLIWINGENFATGVQADLWRCGWADDLPNSRFVDLTAPEVASDFGVPTRGCEAAWQQASSALVYDSEVLDAEDVASVETLFAWAAENPGRLTYAAPPDFTGSMAVRTVLYGLAGGSTAVDTLVGDTVDETAYAALAEPLWDRLRAVEPSLWRGGETYPQSHEEVERLYADGEISAFLTYGPGAVGPLVEDGVFPTSTRQAVLDTGNIANVSFVAIPDNAGDQEGALVLADLLQDPEIQLALYESAGIFPVIDLDRLEPRLQDAFAAVETSPSVLAPAALTRSAVPELPAAYLQRLESDWRSEVLQR